MANDSKTWRCGKYELSFDRPRIMGVLNVTPDSFSDGGEHFDPDAAIEYGLAMLDAGADIIDVGGESTRPGFTPVNPDEEARRVLPVVRALAKEGAIVSIDTRHVAVAKAAVRCGASIVNDVTGFTDPKMVEFVKTSTCGVIVMHAGEVAAPTRTHATVQLDPRQRRLLPRRRARRLPRPRVRPRSRLAAVAASCWVSPRLRPSFRAAWCSPRCRLANRSPRPSLQASRRRPPPSRLPPPRPSRPRPRPRPQPPRPHRSPMTVWPP